MSTHTAPVGKVPDLKVEQLALGELSAQEAATVRARLEAEPGGLQRLSALVADNAATLARHPAPAVAAEVRRRMRREADSLAHALRPARSDARAPRWWLAGLLPAVAAATAVLLVSPGRPIDPGAFEAFELERAKGPLLPGLAIHRQVAEAAELLGAGAPAKAGDVLQLTATPRGAGHGVILSVDGRGAVTLHYPDAPGSSTALPAGLPSVPLPHAYELDDAPAFERFFLVTAHRPIDVGAVVRAAEALAAGTAPEQAALALPADHAQVDFLLRKPQ
jgi:hypothetical protein